MRVRIWEHDDYQCSIVGTCLNVKELRKIARRTDLVFPDHAPEFHIHGMFVRLCKREGPVSRAVQKHLDRKHDGVLRRFARASGDAELRTMWADACCQGNIPGPYWAVMSHPGASDRLKADVFGEVHMLSHLVGAANRADIRRLAEMERRLSLEASRRTRARASYRKKVGILIRRCRELQARVKDMAKEREKSRNGAKLQGSEALKNENAALLHSLGMQSLNLARVEAEKHEIARKLDAYSNRARTAEKALADSRAEVRFLERTLIKHLEEDHPPLMGRCEKAGTSQCPGPDLCGKRILYVGGRMNLVRHYRQMVERLGGVFMHHDGGVEERPQSLPGLLCGADAVVCPVDCVSHDACRRVKEACRHQDRPLKFVRSAGLSSLARTLGELAEPENHGVPQGEA